MYISVNKKTNTRRPVKYAALSSGMTSGVWSEEDEGSVPKRTNRIKLTREQPSTVEYDA